jgi:6-phosphogluconolactonase
VRYSLLPLFALTLATASAADPLVYVGTYTKGPSRGIYAFRFNSKGKLTPLGVAAETLNPSFLAEHPNHKFLYAVNEGGGSDGVSAFAIDAQTGKLKPLNRVPSGGSGPCHLAVDQTGKWLAVANYGSGHMALIPIHADGMLGEAVQVEHHEGTSADPGRQKGPHAHEVVFTPDNRYLLLADLGLDKIFIYKFDAEKGHLTANDPAFGAVAPGAGVRHMAFHPKGKVLYAINEMGKTITAFRWDAAKGSLEAFQSISTVPEGSKGGSTAEIAVNQAGTRVYGSNRGDDSIALFTVDSQKNTLTALDRTPTLGKTPRHFTLDPTGKFLLAANQDTGDIAVFSVHPNSGQLAPVGGLVKDAPSPVCILFVQ